MKLIVEIPDDDESDDWLCHRELHLGRLPCDSVGFDPGLLEISCQSIVLPSGETLRVSAQYGEHNGRCWIMVKEAGKHKASIEARNNDPPPRLIYTTSEGIGVRLSIEK